MRHIITENMARVVVPKFTSQGGKLMMLIWTISGMSSEAHEHTMGSHDSWAVHSSPTLDNVICRHSLCFEFLAGKIVHMHTQHAILGHAYCHARPYCKHTGNYLTSHICLRKLYKGYILVSDTFALNVGIYVQVQVYSCWPDEEYRVRN